MIRKFFIFFIVLLLVLSFTGCPTAVMDDESKFTLSGNISALFNSGTLPTNTVTLKLLPDNKPESTALYTTTTSEWRNTKIAGYSFYASYSFTGVRAGTYYIYGVIDPTTNVYNATHTPSIITISGDQAADIAF